MEEIEANPTWPQESCSYAEMEDSQGGEGDADVIPDPWAPSRPKKEQTRLDETKYNAYKRLGCSVRLGGSSWILTAVQPWLSPGLSHVHPTKEENGIIEDIDAATTSPHPTAFQS